MDTAVLRLFRGGVIPALCGGATFCFGAYGFKVANAATLWRHLEVTADIDRAVCLAHAIELDKHALTCAALTLISAASSVEAAIDFRSYRHASAEALGKYFVAHTPFFARPSVLGTAVASLFASASFAGGCRLFAPQRPFISLPGTTNHQTRRR